MIGGGSENETALGSKLSRSTAREHIEREMCRNFNSPEDVNLFYYVFEGYDDDTFWEIVNLTQGSGIKISNSFPLL